MCGSKYGRASFHIRVRKPWHYARGHKVDVIMAMEPGDPNLPASVDGSVLEQPRRWIKLTINTGTTGLVFADFVNEIFEDLGNNPVVLAWGTDCGTNGGRATVTNHFFIVVA